MKKVILLAGHSIEERGANNNKLNLSEWELNKVLVASIIPHLTNDIEVITFDRSSYTELPNQCNSYNPDLIIEFHLNSSTNNKINGSETLYWNTSKKSKIIANAINATLAETLNVRDRGIKPIFGTNERGAYLLKNTKAPCVIVESAFISNTEDLVNMLNKLPSLAEYLAYDINYLVEEV